MSEPSNAGQLAVDGTHFETRPSGVDVRLGQWYWIKSNGEEVLACVMRIGSNYIGLSRPHVHGETTWRVHLDNFWRDLRFEPQADVLIPRYQQEAQRESELLMAEVHKVMARLGMSDAARIGSPAPAASDGRALVIASAGDAKQYRDALTLAQEKTLPDLFKQIEEANKRMILWAKAGTLGMQAEAHAMKGVLSEVESRIDTVSIYAGIGENAVLIHDGQPAPYSEKLRVMQRRLYMDEECLANYRAGGMEFKHIGDFDRWLLEPENLKATLPFPRCMVAFRVRRYDKLRDPAMTLTQAFIKLDLEKQDRYTYLYVRNGERVYRVDSTLEFSENIFPARSEFDPSEPLVAEFFGQSVKRVITRGEYEALLAEHESLGKADWRYRDLKNSYRSFDPGSVYYDEIAVFVKARIREYNRIAIVIQGLFDRADVLHPHPPVRTWEPGSFAEAIELVYDGSDALWNGEAPDFEAYRAACNSTIDSTSILVGQEWAWMLREQERENRRHRHDWRSERPDVGGWWKPYDDPGPGFIGVTADWKPRARKAVFKWTRLAKRYHGDPVQCSIAVSADDLLNVSAYKPGDFKRFYADRRTRAQYLKWAPLMLAAEDYHAGQIQLADGRAYL